MKYSTIFARTLLSIGMVVLFANTVYASTTVGTIDPNGVGNSNAQFLDASITNKAINTGKFLTQSAYNASVTDTDMKGYMWSAGYGWIVLNCENTTSGCTTTNGNFKVANDGTGTLSGYAWGQQTGWINFGPFTYSTPISRVKIGTDGKFGGTLGSAGYAWSQNFGWIVFDCSSSATCTETDWRPASVRTPATTTTNQTPTTTGGTIASLVAKISAPSIVQQNQTQQQNEVPSPQQPESVPENPAPQEVTQEFEQQSVQPESAPVALPQQNNSPVTAIVASMVSSFNSFATIANTSAVLAQKSIQTINTVAPQLITVIAENVNTKVVAPATVAGSIILPGIVALATSSFSFIDIGLVALRLWSVLLTAVGIRKKHRPWGTVYDSVTKQPIDPAYVVLFDAQGNEVATSITDMDGRYGFVVAPGTYKIVANKTNYVFPSTKMIGKTEDELYANLYAGETITVMQDGDIITKNIPMDAVHFDWNEFEKNQTNRLKFYKRRDVIVARIADIIFWIGMIVSIAGVLVYPNWYNMLIFFLTLVVYILRVTGIAVKPKGSVVQKSTDEPLPFSVVRVLSAITGREVIHKVTDKTGRYYCLLQNGTYKIVIDQKNADQSYTSIPLDETISVDSGYLKREFKV